MLDNVSGVIISAADLRAAPEEVRNWVLCLAPDSPDPEPAPDPSDTDSTDAGSFCMTRFMAQAKDFMAVAGPPAMLAMLREVGAERVSHCTPEQAMDILERIRKYESC